MKTNKVILLVVLAVSAMFLVGCGREKVAQLNDLQLKGDVYVVAKNQRPYSGKFVATFDGSNVIKESGTLRNGKRHGRSDVYYENGRLREISEWENGTQQGESRFFYNDGNLVVIERVLVEWDNSNFYISEFPITQAQYHAVMGYNPSFFNGDNLPVERVNWQNAYDFSKKIGGSLPSAAQWEFAARGGNKSSGFTYSGGNDLSVVGWYNGNSGGRTHIVGQKQPNELGIYDMSGNVWEWTTDSDGDSRMLRGGGWYNDAQDCRIDNPSLRSATYAGNDLGFRVVFNTK